MKYHHEQALADSPEILSVELTAESRLFSIETVHVRYSNGAEANLERIPAGHWPGAVIVVPVLPERQVLLIREYTVGTESYEIGLPQGMRELGETPEQAGGRELKEEIGFGAESLKLLRDLSVASSVLGFRVQVVLAESLYYSPLKGDEPEFLQSYCRNIDELLSGEADLQVSEARSLLALYLAKEHLDGVFTV